MKYKIKRQAANLLIYDLIDDSGKIVFGNGVYEGKIKDVDKLMTTQIIPSFDETPPKEEESMLISEVEALLVEKGYLAKEEKIVDLKPKMEVSRG